MTTHSRPDRSASGPGATPESTAAAVDFEDARTLRRLRARP
ncbi:hypothetical protein [Kitasatospora sp. NPDC058218]